MTNTGCEDFAKITGQAPNDSVKSATAHQPGHPDPAVTKPPLATNTAFTSTNAALSITNAGNSSKPPTPERSSSVSSARNKTASPDPAPSWTLRSTPAKGNRGFKPKASKV